MRNLFHSLYLFSIIPVPAKRISSQHCIVHNEMVKSSNLREKKLYYV